MEQRNIRRMDEKNDEKERKQVIEFIIKAVQAMDDRKLHNVYNFVLHIR